MNCVFQMRRNTLLWERKDLVENFSYMHVSYVIVFRSRRIVFKVSMKLPQNFLFVCTYLHTRGKKVKNYEQAKSYC